MKPEEQRIAIAESQGWVWYRMPEYAGTTRVYRCLFLPEVHEYEGQSPAWLIRADGTERVCSMEYLGREGLVPDFLNDLNAMREAEESLKWIPDDEHCEAAQYYEQLIFVCGDKSDPPDVYEWHLVRATATQRAEAYLRAKGLWKD